MLHSGICDQPTRHASGELLFGMPTTNVALLSNCSLRSVRNVLDRSHSGWDAARQLLKLCQGPHAWHPVLSQAITNLLHLPPSRPFPTYLPSLLTTQISCWFSLFAILHLFAGAGFFFVAKMDKTLWLCIDYRGLNKVTVKNLFLLPLMSMAFDILHGANFFTKLDLRHASHLVRIKEGDK